MFFVLDTDHKRGLSYNKACTGRIKVKVLF